MPLQENEQKAYFCLLLLSSGFNSWAIILDKQVLSYQQDNISFEEAQSELKVQLNLVKQILGKDLQT